MVLGIDKGDYGGDQKNQRNQTAKCNPQASHAFSDAEVLPENETWISRSLNLKERAVEKFGRKLFLVFSAAALEATSMPSCHIVGFYKACSSFHRAENDKCAPDKFLALKISFQVLILMRLCEDLFFDILDLLFNFVFLFAVCCVLLAYT